MSPRADLNCRPHLTKDALYQLSYVGLLKLKTDKQAHSTPVKRVHTILVPLLFFLIYSSLFEEDKSGKMYRIRFWCQPHSKKKITPIFKARKPLQAPQVLQVLLESCDHEYPK